MTLPEKALLALHEQHQRHEAARQAALTPPGEREIAAFQHLFGEPPDEITTEGYLVKDGLVFTRRDHLFRLRGICPHCGREGDAHPILSLVDLGWMLNHVVAEHRCLHRGRKVRTRQQAGE
ncbi:MAG: hypothetical protein HY709_12145 [Candidatus Latescibacteria bacterium]|nr:hypothetical protein [Candidatus Latescibacterota bacterium]